MWPGDLGFELVGGLRSRIRSESGTEGSELPCWVSPLAGGHQDALAAATPTPPPPSHVRSKTPPPPQLRRALPRVPPPPTPSVGATRYPAGAVPLCGRARLASTWPVEGECTFSTTTEFFEKSASKTPVRAEKLVAAFPAGHHARRHSPQLGTMPVAGSVRLEASSPKPDARGTLHSPPPGTASSFEPTASGAQALPE